MFHFEGVESYPVSPPALYPKLCDAGFLARCLPDAEVVDATMDRAEWKMKPKLSFLTGSLDTTLAVTGRVPGESATFRIHGKTIGAASVTVATLVLRPAVGGGTALHWTADITDRTGLLKMVPAGLIQSAAQKVISDVWAALRPRLIET
ncbi:MAG TPA: SRPBCC domain-containing protein [Fimbriiglobus sp.]|jgi:carbon monoxide dehydrogenase subunit G